MDDLLTVASGSFGTIYRGSYKLTNGGKYTIALKTIRLDVEKGREKDRERLELLKVFLPDVIVSCSRSFSERRRQNEEF